MANKIQSSNLWEMETYMTQRRKEIDRKYDSRSSRLTQVQGRLRCRHRINDGVAGILSANAWFRQLGYGKLVIHCTMHDLRE